jgi:hypothetical protein
MPLTFRRCLWRMDLLCWTKVRILYLVHIFSSCYIIPPEPLVFYYNSTLSIMPDSPPPEDLISESESEEDGDLAADFTLDKSGRVCQICGAAAPPGRKFRYIYNNNKTKTGRFTCKGCRKRYRQKPTTRRIEGLFFFLSLFSKHYCA